MSFRVERHEGGSSIAVLVVVHSCGHENKYGYGVENTALRAGPELEHRKCMLCENRDILRTNKDMVRA